MFEVLLTVLALVVVLGLWHAVLVRFGPVPGWARSIVRVTLLLATLSEAGVYLWVQWRTRQVPLDQVSHVLNEIQQVGAAVHVTSAGLLLVGAVVLGFITLRRWVSRAD